MNGLGHGCDKAAVAEAALKSAIEVAKYKKRSLELARGCARQQPAASRAAAADWLFGKRCKGQKKR